MKFIKRKEDKEKTLLRKALQRVYDNYTGDERKVTIHSGFILHKISVALFGCYSD